VVERVNPEYQPPPGTPSDLVSLRNQIIDTLAARAQAEQFSQLMQRQEKHHKDNEKPLADAQKGTEQSITATEAHKKAIANREEANNRKKQQEDSAGDKLDDYDGRRGKLVALTVPLKGLASFTGLASSLPDSPGFVGRFKRRVLKVNSDAEGFLAQLDKMDQAVADQKTQQAERRQDIATDGATIKSTAEKAEDSGDWFDDAKESADDFDAKNKERKEEAERERKAAQQTSGALDRQVRQKESQAVSLAAAIQSWAIGHRQARLAALEATRKRLEGMGYRVTEVREK
jgi:hypothetical protein